MHLSLFNNLQRLPGFSKLTSTEVLHRLDFQSLELRCLHCDLVWCYTVLSGHQVDINNDSSNSAPLYKLEDTSTNCVQATFVLGATGQHFSVSAL